MAVQLCPVCECEITEDSYEFEEVMYCCESCATGGQCGCGCCEATEESD